MYIKLLQELDDTRKQLNERYEDLEDAKVALDDLEETNESK